MSLDYLQVWQAFVESACIAGDMALTLRQEGKVQAQEKPDGSPVTNADYAADRLITEYLSGAFPEIPLISEEGTWSPPSLHEDSYYFLADPLDATRNYIKGRDEFTVNLTLMRGIYPVIGVIYAPCLKTLWSAILGRGSYVQTAEGVRSLQVKREMGAGVRIIAGSHGAMKYEEKWTPYTEGHDIVEKQAVSSAIKFGLIAEGQADLYVRFEQTCAWDTSAGQLIVEEAGGRVETLTGHRFAYENPSFINAAFAVKGW